MINSPLLDKKSKIILQNFLYIEYFKKRVFLFLSKELVLSSVFFSEKFITEGLPTNLHKTLRTTLPKHIWSGQTRLDQVYIMFVSIVIALVL